MNISLPDALRAFVETEVAEGGYGTTSEYFRDLLRAAKKRKAEEHLETLLLAGLNSGEAAEMTPQDWSDIRQAVRDRLAAASRVKPTA